MGSCKHDVFVLIFKGKGNTVQLRYGTYVTSQGACSDCSDCKSVPVAMLKLGMV